MTALAPPVAVKVAKLIPLLSSDKDGEVAATARAIERTLRSAGLDWHTLAGAIEKSPTIYSGAPYHEPPKPAAEPRSWEQIAQWCYENDFGRLSPKERDFIENARVWFIYGEPTLKQANWLQAIYLRLRRKGRQS